MSDVLYETKGAVATITLNRPEARNAYTDAMVVELIESLDRAERDAGVHVVVLTGAGSSFCAGGDLKAMRDRTGMFAGDPVELRDQYLQGLQRVTRRFNSFEKPVVAAVNGAAIGAGLGLALCCDLRIASENARFGSTFAKVGLIPGDGGAYLLTRVVGFARALELVMTARVLDAHEALAMNLVTRVVSPDRVLEEAYAMAEQIAALPPKAIRMSKTALYRCVDRDLETSLQITAALQGLIQCTDEHEEAVESLLASISGKSADQ